MSEKFTISLKKIIDEFKLEVIYTPKDPAELLIDENDVNRPGLQLMGFYEYFNPAYPDHRKNGICVSFDN